MDSLKKDEYKSLYYIGLGLIVISMLLSDVMALQYQFWIFGFAVGWIAAVWFVRYSINNEKNKYKNLISNIITKIKKLLPNPKKLKK